MNRILIRMTVLALSLAGGTATAHAMNVSYEDQIVATFDGVASVQGRLDILVNSAGIGGFPGALEMELDVWNKVIQVNLDGTFLCARTAARHMLSISASSSAPSSPILLTLTKNG